MTADLAPTTTARGATMTPLDRDATTAAHHADLHRQRQAAENDLRSQTRAVRELTAQLEQARRTIAAQDALIRQHDTLLGRLRDLDEQRDRAWADYDMAADFRHLAADPGSVSGRAQDEPAGAGEWEWAVRLTRTGGGTWILPRDDEQHARLFFAEEGYEGAALIRRRIGPWESVTVEREADRLAAEARDYQWTNGRKS